MNLSFDANELETVAELDRDLERHRRAAKSPVTDRASCVEQIKDTETENGATNASEQGNGYHVSGDNYTE